MSALTDYLQKLEDWDTKTFLVVYKSDFSKRSMMFAKTFSFFGTLYFWGLVWLAWFIYGYITKDYYLLVLFTGGFEQSIIIHFLIRYKIIKRNRPYITLKKEGVKKHDDFIKIPYLMSESERKSFPSGHVAFLLFFGFIFSVYFDNLIILFIFLGLDVVMALCRMVLGVHYPIDVIFGFVFAIFYAFLYLAWTSPFWVEFYYWIGPIVSDIVHLRFLFP